MPKRNNMFQYYICYPILFGMFIGCIFYLVICVNNDHILSDEYLKLFDWSNINSIIDVHNITGVRMNNYIIHKRIIQILLFITLSYTISFSYSAFLYSIINGFIYGFSYCILFVQYGIKGFLITVIGFFPHMLIYVTCMVLGGRWIYSSCNKVNKLSFLIKISVIFMLLAIAMYYEINFQKIFLKIFTNI